MRKYILIFLLLGTALTAGAQSKSFTLGKWMEIQNAILKELNRCYVDSLPVDRMERTGVDAMLSDLDPYTIYIPQEENEDLQLMIRKTYGGIGAVIYKPDVNGNVIINEPYEGSPAQKYNLCCGDEILEIDGVTVHGLTSQQASEKMRGEPGTKVVFKVLKLRSGKEEEITVTREQIHISDVQYAGMLDPAKLGAEAGVPGLGDDGLRTGYLRLGGFSEGVGAEVRREVMRMKNECGMQKFVLDLRGNGGGLLGEAVNIVSIFVPKGSLVVSAKGREKNANYACYTDKAPVDTRMPVVVLINSGSASASEIVAGALQDMDRATIMGQRSYGKGLVQSIRELPYGGQMKLTTAKYYTPSGRCVQAIDYSHRAEDGSVGHIPDSLTHEFKTAHGRTVRDGGGITPDVSLSEKNWSRLTYSLVMYGVLEHYTLEYVRTHESIPEVSTFRFDEYDKFVEFAKGQEFDYRSTALALFDQMKEELKKDGLEEKLSDQLTAMQKSLEMSKEEFLWLMKDEIVPFIEEEIVVRYHFQKAGYELQLRYDDQLREALGKPLI